MSRSVTIPTTPAFSQTGNVPTPSSFILAAAFWSVSSGPTNSTSLVMISLINMIVLQAQNRLSRAGSCAGSALDAAVAWERDAIPVPKSASARGDGRAASVSVAGFRGMFLFEPIQLGQGDHEIRGPGVIPFFDPPDGSLRDCIAPMDAAESRSAVTSDLRLPPR